MPIFFDYVFFDEHFPNKFVIANFARPQYSTWYRCFGPQQVECEFTITGTGNYLQHANTPAGAWPA